MRPARILIIEDNPATLELMIYLFDTVGHEVSAAVDGMDGVTTAERERPDLIVCDVQLPSLDGFGVVNRLKSHPERELRAIPIVAVTSLARVGERDRMLQAGFDGYLPKPIVPSSFVADVMAFLRDTPAA